MGAHILQQTKTECYMLCFYVFEKVTLRQLFANSDSLFIIIFW